MRCAAVFTPGHASASTCSMYRRICGRRRNRSIRTKPPTTGRTSAASARAEHLLELVRGRDLELIVAAVPGRLVGAPAQETGRVAEAIALHVVVLHFADALDPERLPRQILAGAPPALAAGHARRAGRVGFRPITPRIIVERVCAQRFELDGELAALRHRERR